MAASAAVARAARPAQPAQRPAAPTSSSSRAAAAHACCMQRAGGRSRRRPTLLRAAAQEEPEAAQEDPTEEEDVEVSVYSFIQRVREEDQQLEAAAAAAAGQPGQRKVLRITQQRGLSPWEPSAGVAQAAPAAEGGAAQGEGEEEERATYEQLLRQLPGLQRELRSAAQERAGLPSNAVELDVAEQRMQRFERKAEAELSEWDLRAKMEKRRRQQRDMEAWDARRAAVGRYPSIGADWRTDVRCGDTGDPTDPAYREWSHKEIWDLITMGGRNADPRSVELFVRNPDEVADAPSQGAKYAPDPEEWFEARGQLIREDDLAAIASSAVGDGSEAALLAAEFDDFDEELQLAGVDYEGGGYGGGGDGGGDDDGF